MLNKSTLNVRVAHRRDEADGIRAYELVPVDERPLPRFTAGAHIDVHTPAGVIRQYSLSNDPRESARYVIGILRDPASRGGSRSMHDQVDVGYVLTIGSPRNNFELVPGRHRTLLFAGGIGITPLLSMMEHLEATDSDYRLHYCTRNAEKTAFLTRTRSPDVVHRVHVHHDDGDGSQKLQLSHVLGAQPPGTHLYVCGPTGFMEFVLEGARALGWPSGCLHAESFTSAASALDPLTSTGFSVVLARSGRVVPVRAEQTAAAALIEAGIDVPLSCEQGICGTCLTRVLEGEPEHRDVYMTDEEHARNDAFTPCCSRARSSCLVVDL